MYIVRVVKYNVYNLRPIQAIELRIRRNNGNKNKIMHQRGLRQYIRGDNGNKSQVKTNPEITPYLVYDLQCWINRLNFTADK